MISEMAPVQEDAKCMTLDVWTVPYVMMILVWEIHADKQIGQCFDI